MDALAQLKAALADRYEVERELGRGGMATVYLARDIKHARSVALKLLDPELGAVLGPERFLSEIRVTATLQHPHLLPLFDSGEAGGLLYYVMPYVEGESLRARLERERQLPIDEAIRIAIAVAGALDYAHRHHVIHRDLKPENILLHDGEPVVADFGIALAVSNAGGARITQTGLSLGTPQYMSPEQATGDRQIDGRTDIYSLGAVLYEMLVGEPPYTGTTVQAVIAKALTDKPRPIRLARESVPAHVEAAIERALAKLPADRWLTAAQFADALQGKVPTTARPPGIVATSTRSPGRPRSRSVAVGALFTTILGVAVVTTALIAHHGATTSAARTVRFVIAPAKDAALEPAPGNPAAVSNDGSRIVYVGRDASGARMLFERGIGDLEARVIPGTKNALSPFFSPDDRWIGFITGGDFRLKKLNVEGGPAVELVSLDGQPTGAAWGGDSRDVIVIGSALALSSGLEWTTTGGGALRPLTTIDTTKGELGHLYPVFLEDGSTVLFSIRGNGGANDLVIAETSLRDGVVRRTDIAGVMPLGVFDGRLAYLRGDGTVMAVPFDVKRARATGPAVPMFDGVPVGAVDTKILANAAGDLVYESGLDRVQLVIAANHDSRPVIDESRDYAFPRLSPDGKRVAMAISGVQGTDIWIYEFATTSLTRLTTGETSDRPEWTPDGRRVVFRSTRGGAAAIWWQPVDASAPAEQLTHTSTTGGAYEGVVSPDGKTLAFRLDTPKNARDIYVMPLDGDRVAKPLISSPADELMPRWSPDGQWIVYVSDESRDREVYVRRFPGPGGRYPVSTGGGVEPLWSQDGHTIYYRNGDRVIAARVTTSPTFTVLSRATVSDARYATSTVHANYDVTGDGRLLMLKQIDEPRLTVALNWRNEIEARTSRAATASRASPGAPR